MNKAIKLNEAQKAEIVGISSRAVRESTFHMRQIIEAGNPLYFWRHGGTVVTLRMAAGRRQFNMRNCNLALRGLCY